MTLNVTAAPILPTIKWKALTPSPTIGRLSVWEFRAQRPAEDVWRFYYCIENRREHRGYVVDWHDGANTHFFKGLVPNKSERFNFRDTVTPELDDSVWKGTITIGETTTDAETIRASASPFKNEKRVKLRSHSVLDVPANPQIASAIMSDSYTSWKSTDLFRVTIDFTSTFNPKNPKIWHALAVSVVGDETQASALEDFPLELDVRFPGSLLGSSKKIFWGAPLRVSGFVRDATIASSAMRAKKGDVTEQVGVIAIGLGNVNYGLVPITFFGPIIR